VVDEDEPTLIRGSTPRPAGGLRLLISDDGGGDLLWLNRIACADMDIDDYFVEAGHAITSTAASICRGCPVRLECLRHAYDMQVAGGYFGGLSPGQRREYSLEQAVQFVLSDPPKDDDPTAK
jgi:WhiB family redox-sensing transcriptional regulator